MRLMISLLMGAAIFVGVSITAKAQTQYVPYPMPPQIASNPYYQEYAASPMSPTPPSWSFDPYTSGLGPCPQRGPGDERCSERIAPSYGQPSYWSR